MRKLRISRGKHRLNPALRNGETDWPSLAKKLLDFKVTGETYAEYIAMPADQQADIKDVGYMIGGPFEGKARRKDELICRSVVTLDVDHCKDLDEVRGLLDAYLGFACVVHSTHKHSGDNPRLRIAFPLSRDVTPFEYEAVARNLADWSDIELFDDTTFQVSRIMYWPSRSSDGAVIAENFPGNWVNPDDWEPAQEFLDWPRSSRDTRTHAPVSESADPLTRPGMIGAFNRTYDIHAAIENFLSDTFESTEWDNRYRPVGATGPAGAIVYDDIFMYSWHENPPEIMHRNVNAYDLVRLCLWGDTTDKEELLDTPVMQRTSMKEMNKLVAADTQVMANFDELDFDDEPDKPKGPTADEFLIELGDWTPTSAAQCDAKLHLIAQYEPHQTDMMLKTLQDKYPVKPGIQTLRDSLKRIRKQLVGIDDDDDAADIERELIQEFLDEHYAGGEHLRRVGKVFWIYRHGVWRMMGDEAVRGKLVKTITRIREDRPQEIAQLVASVGDSKTSALTASLFGLLTVQLAEVSEVDDDPLMLMRRIPEPVINCFNGELHLDYNGNMDVRDHNPAHFYTLQVSTEYDPDAQCPEWDRFTGMLFADAIDPEDMVRHIEELGGYIVNMSRWLKNWVLFHGPTDTGKSTLLDVFKELLGESCLAMELGRFGVQNSFADSSLLGKLLLADDDFDKSASLPDGFIKKISEEKRITSDIKFGSPITFQARALPLVCANHWPVSRDVSDAFRERALVLEFNHRIQGPEKSDRRRDLMMLELPGILNRFIAGLVRLRTRGEWDVPIDAAISHETWEGNSNSAMRFVRDRMTEVPGVQTATPPIWRDYLAWSSDEGGYRLSKPNFYERLDQVIGGRRTIKGSQYYVDWELLPPDELGYVDGDDITRE